MRRKKLLEFASWLARRRGRFSMGDCGYCMAGWALKWKGVASNGQSLTLAKMFGLEPELSEDLFIGWGRFEREHGHAISRITRMEAVTALRNVANGKTPVWEG